MSNKFSKWIDKKLSKDDPLPPLHPPLHPPARHANIRTARQEPQQQQPQSRFGLPRRKKKETWHYAESTPPTPSTSPAPPPPPSPPAPPPPAPRLRHLSLSLSTDLTLSSTPTSPTQNEHTPIDDLVRAIPAKLEECDVSIPYTIYNERHKRAWAAARRTGEERIWRVLPTRGGSEGG
ncbi:hypothetical protein VE03_06108 [Pseudogymnoascus sp. 23342-1-I1]|nr:hypothetical protein VE03_06108 [Pseudogymnoascus sp. 23342-1-I1]